MKTHPSYRLASLIFISAMILLLGASCSSKKTTTNTNQTNNASTSNTSTTNTLNTNSISSFEHACQLYSQAEAEKIVGVTLVPPNPPTGKIFLSSYDNNYYCVYATAATGATARSVWVGVDRFGSATTARANYDANKARLDRAIDVTGYGDLAYWDADQGFFRVLRGGDVFTTQVLYGLNGNQEQAKTIMLTILARLP
ncbi:MAG: hypothetical protein PHH01_01770 [Patescibacteria group bacterium]|nr:hypothetical protein [Patescibacteria group bacterium]